jgi:hypothetical protein
MKTFKGFLKITLAMGWISGAMAINDPNWERPIMEAKMEKATSASPEFEDAHNIHVTLHQRFGVKGPTSITLAYEQEEAPATKISLPIVDVKVSTCGTMIYIARKTEAQKMTYVTLVDHSQRTCDEVVSAPWMLQVRQIEGIVGIGTSSGLMTLHAEPTPVYTIAQIINPILDR